MEGRSELEKYLNPDDWWLHGEAGPPELSVWDGPDYNSRDGGDDTEFLLDEQALNEWLDVDPETGDPNGQTS